MRREWQPPKLETYTSGSTEVADTDTTPKDTWRPTPAMEMAPPSLIISNLYVGSMADACDVLWRGNPLGVTAIVNCAQDDWLHQVKKGRCGSESSSFCSELRAAFDELEEAPEGSARCGSVMGVEYMGFSAKDELHHEASERDESRQLSTGKVAHHFPASMAFIRRHLGCGEKVLIHCLRGENRSAAVCAAFLTRECGMPVEEAIQLLRNKRGANALSNQGFVEELRQLSQLSLLSPAQSVASSAAQTWPESPAKVCSHSIHSEGSSTTEWPPTPVKPPYEGAGTAQNALDQRRSIACALL